MRVLLYYGLLAGGGCERRMGDLCRWLLDAGDECWIVASGAYDTALTILCGHCRVPANRILYMPPGGVFEDFLNETAANLEADVIDHQWWGAGIPKDGFAKPAICTLHGLVTPPPAGYYKGIISVETLHDEHAMRALTPNYQVIWNWVNLDRFPFREELGESAAFFGRSFKMINAFKVAEHWPGMIDCYGMASEALPEFPPNMEWHGFADTAEVMPRYRVIFGSAQVVLEAMAAGRFVIAGQGYFIDTVPAGHLVTPENVDALAQNQFYCERRGDPELKERTSLEVYADFQWAMENDLPEERRYLRQWVESYHSMDTQCGRIRQLYEECIG